MSTEPQLFVGITKEKCAEDDPTKNRKNPAVKFKEVFFIPGFVLSFMSALY